MPTSNLTAEPAWAASCRCGNDLAPGKLECDECAGVLVVGDGGVERVPLCVCGARAYDAEDGWRCTISDELADICPLDEQ